MGIKLAKLFSGRIIYQKKALKSKKPITTEPSSDSIAK
jgi:hypothetical protein